MARLAADGNAAPRDGQAELLRVSLNMPGERTTAQPSHEALRHNESHSVAHSVIRDAQLDQPLDGITTVAGMEGADHELAGQCRLKNFT